MKGQWNKIAKPREPNRFWGVTDDWRKRAKDEQRPINDLGLVLHPVRCPTCGLPMIPIVFDGPLIIDHQDVNEIPISVLCPECGILA